MKKIYYVPGLISALIIPILFWYYGNQRVHPPYTVVDLGIPAKIRSDATFDNTFEPYRNWNYKKIVVKPNTALQNQEFYVSELKKLQARNQKESGIEFVINDENNYQDFIALINAMALSKQETYGVDIEKTGHFFAVHFYKDPNVKKSEYDCLLCYDIIRPEYRPNFFETTQTLLPTLPKKIYYFIFGFLLFLNISMLSIWERFQLHYDSK
ncbi:hypothetical protein F3J23_15065 [Chryseobacterium sp. Tr-659]|uniref:hypothetical protein n=1 Tax=Chryseobacterium sp. Tr-659 TaxID=2608340 RepID=UPI00141E9061|nr:hypothetical protein [Chryseobacterium sp. Tr-659]NIF06766.1 hypothetical protein [Chryseobacterium sp. Tr-659]